MYGNFKKYVFLSVLFVLATTSFLLAGCDEKKLVVYTSDGERCGCINSYQRYSHLRAQGFHPADTLEYCPPTLDNRYERLVLTREASNITVCPELRG